MLTCKATQRLQEGRWRQKLIAQQSTLPLPNMSYRLEMISNGNELLIQSKLMLGPNFAYLEVWQQANIKGRSAVSKTSWLRKKVIHLTMILLLLLNVSASCSDWLWESLVISRPRKTLLAKHLVLVNDHKGLFPVTSARCFLSFCKLTVNKLKCKWIPALWGIQWINLYESVQTTVKNRNGKIPIDTTTKK